MGIFRKKNFKFVGKGDLFRSDKEMQSINREEANNAFKVCKKEIMNTYMKSKGFLLWKSSSYVRLNRIGVVECVYIQKEKYGSKTFTVNLDIYPIYVPQIYMSGGLGDRLGSIVYRETRYMDRGQDFWWDYKDLDTAKRSFENVIEAMEKFGLLWFEKYEHSEYMRCIKENNYKKTCYKWEEYSIIFKDTPGALKEIIKENIKELKLPEKMIGAELSKKLDEYDGDLITQKYDSYEERKGSYDDVKEIKINTRQLEALINKMVIGENARDSRYEVSWKAYRKAEQLTDPSLLPTLQKMICERAEVQDKDFRRASYFIMGKILRYSFDKDACTFFIKHLTMEKDIYVISSMLDLLADIDLPADMNIESIILYSQNEKWLIRHSAIRALGSSPTDGAKKALAFYLNQTDEKKYKDEITYANASMGKIGDVKDIPLLEKHVNSRSRDVKESARFAIARINGRIGK